MIGVEISYEDRSRQVRDAAEKAGFENFRHAASVIRKRAMSLMRKRKGASPPGEPPHTHTRRLPKAIVFWADAYGAVIGPAFSLSGGVGGAHEHGGEFRGRQYDERPFMFPALLAMAGQFQASWRGSIGA